MRWLVLLLCVAACAEPPVAPDPQPYGVVSSDLWAGTELLITSTGFAPPHPTPVVSLNGLAIAPRVVDDTTLAIPTPLQAGAYQLLVVSPHVRSIPTTIHLRGFLGWEAGPAIGGRTEIKPGPPAVYAQSSDGVVLWNISGRLATPVSGVIHDGSCVEGLGASYDPSHLVVHWRPCPAQRGWRPWDLAGGPLDTMPAGGERISVELAPNKVLHSHHHEFYLIDCDTTPCQWEFVTAESVTDVVFSPERKRMVPLNAFFPPEGNVVIDVPTASVSYRLPAVRDATAAAFSETGDTLYVGGIADTRLPLTFRILRARASDGHVDTVMAVPQLPVAMAVDPTRPWLYILFDGPASLDVWDRVTFARVASLPIEHGGCVACFAVPRVLVSPLERRRYVINTSRRGVPTPAFPYTASLFVFDTP